MSSVSCSVMTDSLQPHQAAHQASLSMDSPGKNTGVGCHSLPRGSSWSRDQTQVSLTAGRFFTIWTTREGISNDLFYLNSSCSVCGSWQCSLSHRCSALCRVYCSNMKAIILILSMSSFWTILEDSEYILGKIDGLVLLGEMSQRLQIYFASLVSPRNTSLHLAQKQWNVTPAQCDFDLIPSSCQNGS